MLQITDQKQLALYLDPWEESLLNFVMSQIYMEFSKLIQSMNKHYFYSHQKPTKLASGWQKHYSSLARNNFVIILAVNIYPILSI